MKKTIEKDIQICDVCNREVNYVKSCISCGKDMCVLCNASIPGCIHSVDCCKECANNEIVLEIVQRHAPHIASVIGMRDKELRKLKQNTSTEIL